MLNGAHKNLSNLLLGFVTCLWDMTLEDFLRRCQNVHRFSIWGREFFRKVKKIKGLCGGVQLVRRTIKSRRLTPEEYALPQ
jgi:hypothetical protein